MNRCATGPPCRSTNPHVRPHSPTWRRVEHHAGTDVNPLRERPRGRPEALAGARGRDRNRDGSPPDRGTAAVRQGRSTHPEPTSAAGADCGMALGKDLPGEDPDPRHAADRAGARGPARPDRRRADRPGRLKSTGRGGNRTAGALSRGRNRNVRRGRGERSEGAPSGLRTAGEGNGMERIRAGAGL